LKSEEGRGDGEKRIEGINLTNAKKNACMKPYRATPSFK
jgi:hypothetical protein